MNLQNVDELYKSFIDVAQFVNKKENCSYN